MDLTGLEPAWRILSGGHLPTLSAIAYHRAGGALPIKLQIQKHRPLTDSTLWAVTLPKPFGVQRNSVGSATPNPPGCFVPPKTLFYDRRKLSPLRLTVLELPLLVQATRSRAKSAKHALPSQRTLSQGWCISI